MCSAALFSSIFLVMWPHVRTGKGYRSKHTVLPGRARKQLETDPQMESHRPSLTEGGARDATTSFLFSLLSCPNTCHGFIELKSALVWGHTAGKVDRHNPQRAFVNKSLPWKLSGFPQWWMHPFVHWCKSEQTLEAVGEMFKASKELEVHRWTMFPCFNVEWTESIA